VRLLADESVERPVIEALRAEGHDVASVDEDDPGSDDSRVLARSARERRVLVTNDADFAALAFLRREASAGIVLVRLPRNRSAFKAHSARRRPGLTRLPSLSSKKIVRALSRAGFTEAPDRGKGSHRAFVKRDAQGRTRLVIVPQGRDVPAARCWRFSNKPGCRGTSSSRCCDSAGLMSARARRR
jgi:predicted RNA binding protein YcfA (HicA-like mRNA interferase family)